MKKFKGILFDLDGTLADTEHIHFDAWREVLATKNVHFDHAWFEQWIGITDMKMIASVAAENGFKHEAETLLEQKRQMFRKMLPDKMKILVGVEVGLKNLSNVPKAIVTMSNRQDAEAMLKHSILGNYFDILVTSTDVQQFKPHPECYLLGAEKLGLAADDCVAVEDSISGLNAAINAGCFAIGVGNSLPQAKLPAGDAFYETTELALVELGKMAIQS